MLLAARLARQAASLRAVTTSQPSTSGRALCGAWGVSSTSTTCNLRRGAVALSSSSSSDRIDPPDVRKLAAMATIAVTDDEIAGWFAQLLAVDVEGVPPATDAGVGGGSLRADKVDVSLAGADEALGQAPELEGGFVRVPKVV